MDDKVKKIIWWSIALFIFIIVPILVILAAYDIISLGVSIGIMVLIFIILFFIIAVFYFIKTKRDIKVEDIKIKADDPISDKEALDIIKSALKEREYSDYIKEGKDIWTAYLGSPQQYPIFIITCKLEYDRSVLCVGMVNKITKQKTIKKYQKLEMDRKEIEIDILNSANLLSATPGEYKYRTTRRITPEGSELEIVEPVDIEGVEKKKEDEGVLG